MMKLQQSLRSTIAVNYVQTKLASVHHAARRNMTNFMDNDILNLQSLVIIFLTIATATLLQGKQNKLQILR
jgi:hypothetical protein